MNKVESGIISEETSKKILADEGYKIIEHSSDLKWTSPYDFIVEKDNVKFLLEIRSREDYKNSFALSIKKIEGIRKEGENILFLFLNKKGYILLKLEKLSLFQNQPDSKATPITNKLKKSKPKILDLLKRGEKNASEISIYVGLNYYKTLELLKELIEEHKIELLNFREKKYYKLKQ